MIPKEERQKTLRGWPGRGLASQGPILQHVSNESPEIMARLNQEPTSTGRSEVKPGSQSTSWPRPAGSISRHRHGSG